METVTSVFNAVGGFISSAAFYGFVVAPAVAVGGLVWWRKGPKMLKPDSQTAFVVTGHKFPNIWKREQFVVRTRPEWFLRMGSSAPEEVSLNSFSVKIVRRGTSAAAKGESDETLTLKDNVKAEIDTEFFVRVDTSDDANVIIAKQRLGSVDEATIRKFLEPLIDGALRDAAAKMTIEEIQGDRETFLKNVKDALDLKPYGLTLDNVALRNFRQAPVESFDPNNYFDAQGLEKVRKVTEASKIKINEEEQTARTAIADRDAGEEEKRLTIAERKRQAELAQEEKLRQAAAEQARRVAEFEATSREQSESARIAADEKIALADVRKAEQLAVANERRQQQEEAARIARQQTVELAEVAKKVAIHGKVAEEAAAEKAANEQRAEAVAAAEGVTTARQVAEAERSKQIDVIAAEASAQKAAATDRIAAETRVYVAQQGKVEAEAQADAIRIEAQAAKDAAGLAAEGAYAEIYQKLKAAADGKEADAAAQQKLNEALNALSPEAMAHLVEKARVELTPEIVTAATQAFAKIGNVSITSMDGVPYPGAGGVASGNGGAPSGGGVVDQFLNAVMAYQVMAPTMKKLAGQLGADTDFAKHLPGGGLTEAFAGEGVTVPEGIAAEAPSSKDKAPAPGPKGM